MNAAEVLIMRGAETPAKQSQLRAVIYAPPREAVRRRGSGRGRARLSEVRQMIAQVEAEDRGNA